MQTEFLIRAVDITNQTYRVAVYFAAPKHLLNDVEIALKGALIWPRAPFHLALLIAKVYEAHLRNRSECQGF
ncbi:hypothetical protein VN12_13360 [Pirellula sp. SH-Sr6A]|nr:hypothetical protein VN12_13360 [Pirellula sp. SH-Sr6A]